MLLIVLAGSPDAALADSASAEASFERGRSLLQAGNTREACAAFQASLDDEFQYGTLYNLAGCNDKLGNLASAWRMYTRLAEEDPNPGRRARSRELATKLWPRVPKVIVAITTPPPELSVRLDGDSVTSKLTQPLPVDPGEHVIVATAPGYREWRTTTHVEAASAELRVAVELEAVDSPERAPAQPKIIEYRRRRAGHRTAAYVLMVSAVVGLGVSGGLAYYEQIKYKEAVRRIDDGGPGTYAENRAAANHAINVSRYVATPLFVASAVTFGVGIVLYVKSKTVVLTPIATSTSAGVGLSGSF